MDENVKVSVDKNGKNIVVINDIRFRGKRKIKMRNFQPIKKESIREMLNMVGIVMIQDLRYLYMTIMER